MNGYLSNLHTVVSATPNTGWNDISSYQIMSGMWFSMGQSNQLTYGAVSPASGAASGVLLQQVNFTFGETCALTAITLGYMQACCNYPASSNWGTDATVYATAVAQVVSAPSGGTVRGSIPRVNASGCAFSNSPTISLIPTKVGMNSVTAIQVLAGDFLSLELGFKVSNTSTSGSMYSVTLGYDDLYNTPLAGTGCTASASGSPIVQLTVFNFATNISLIMGHVGQFYSASVTAQNIPSAATPTYTLAPGSTALPSWLTLNSMGVLSGTPISTETDSFTIRCTDAGGLYTERTFTLQVVLL